jgi:hypothetical protein
LRSQALSAATAAIKAATGKALSTLPALAAALLLLTVRKILVHVDVFVRQFGWIAALALARLPAFLAFLVHLLVLVVLALFLLAALALLAALLGLAAILLTAVALLAGILVRALALILLIAALVLWHLSLL